MFDSLAKRPLFFVFNRNPPLIASPTLCHITPHSLIPLPPYPPAAVIVHCSVHYLTHCVGVDPPACPPVGASFCCRMQIYSPQKRRNISLAESTWDTHTNTHAYTHTHNAKGFRLSTYNMATSVWPGGVGTGQQCEAFGCEIEMRWLNNRCL